MSSTPAFWRAFGTYSFNSPWIIGPATQEQPSVPEAESVGVELGLATPFGFVTHDLQGAPVLENMLERMQVAVRQDADTLTCLSADKKSEIKKLLNNLQADQRILVFGENLWPFANKTQGVWEKVESGAVLMLTHDLRDLKANPNLKKSTWEHLQKFVGMK